MLAFVDGPLRRKVSLTGLPGWARYCTAIIIAVGVGGAAWLWGGRLGPPAWYLTGIRIASIGLILWVLVWLIRKLISNRN
jgi:cellulose synthase/poly-beta-1,6-N-acetylglucosamine synthase-like glycosyltransferase